MLKSSDTIVISYVTLDPSIHGVCFPIAEGVVFRTIEVVALPQYHERRQRRSFFHPRTCLQEKIMQEWHYCHAMLSQEVHQEFLRVLL